MDIATITEQVHQLYHLLGIDKDNYVYTDLVIVGVSSLILGYIVGKVHQRSKERCSIRVDTHYRGTHHTYQYPAHHDPHTDEESVGSEGEDDIDRDRTVTDRETDPFTYKTLDMALKTSDSSRVNVFVEELHANNGNYSGLIFDSSSSSINPVPFCFCEDDINTYEDEGLIAVILNDAMKTEKPVQILGHKSDEHHAFIVKGLKYTLDKVDYLINWE